MYKCMNPLTTTAVGLQNTYWQQDRKVQAWHFGIGDKIEWKCLIIDIACLFDTRVKDKEKEKIGNHEDQKQELKGIWKLRRVTVAPSYS